MPKVVSARPQRPQQFISPAPARAARPRHGQVGHHADPLGHDRLQAAHRSDDLRHRLRAKPLAQRRSITPPAAPRRLNTLPALAVAASVSRPGAAQPKTAVVQPAKPAMPVKPPAIVNKSAKPIIKPAATASHRYRLSAAKTPDGPPPAVLARRLPLDMELPGEDSPSSFDLGQRHKGGLFRRRASRALALAMVVVITMGGLLFSQSYLKLHKIFKGGTGTAAALNENVKPELLKGEGRGRVNVLLLGRGGGTHDAPDLTDTIMVASVDPVNHTATLLSVPRDLWVNVPDLGVMKLNAAWQSGAYKYLGKTTPGTTDTKAIQAGFKSVDSTVEDVLGINIDYNLMIDFQAFQQAIDTVGGVTINVPADLVDPTMAWENGNDPVLAHAGVQTMTGNKALIYVRSRETSSDFARGERQRAVLLALKSKVETLGTLSNPKKLSGLMSAFGDNVQTDLSIKNASRLYGIVKSINASKVNSIALVDTNNPAAVPYVTTGNVDGQSIVLPKAGLFKYDAIRQFVRGQLKDPYITKENAKVMVLNGTPMPGLATTSSDELRSYGYNVFKLGNTPSSGWTTTTLIDLSKGKKKYTKNYLEQRYKTKASDSLSDTSIPTNGADFVIILGNDQTSPPQS